MLRIAFRIYVTANLLIYFFFALFLFPEGVGFGFIALLYSAVFSIPSLLVLYGCFYLAQRLRPSISGCWILLFLTVGIGGFLPIVLFSVLENDPFGDTTFLLLSLGSAVGGTLLQIVSINRYFKILQHETEQNIENN